MPLAFLVFVAGLEALHLHVAQRVTGSEARQHLLEVWILISEFADGGRHELGAEGRHGQSDGNVRLQKVGTRTELVVELSAFEVVEEGFEGGENVAYGDALLGQG